MARKLHFKKVYRGVEQLVARWAHNPKVVGSSPAPATQALRNQGLFLCSVLTLTLFTEYY